VCVCVYTVWTPPPTKPQRGEKAKPRPQQEHSSRGEEAEPVGLLRTSGS
jgi:hypothetical protein